MKKFYDKLLLALAVLALLGGVSVYFLKAGGADAPGSRGPVQIADNPYQPVPIPDPETTAATWPEPEPQSSGQNWVYDVFTPPKIYLDAEGNFSAEPPVDPTITEPFGIYLAELQREPYRIQMQGYSGDREKPEEAVLFFFDEERQLRFFIREGEVNEESEVEVLDFRIDRDVDEDGNVSVTAVATVLDKRTSEELELNDEERLLNPEISLVFRSEEDPNVEVAMTVEPEDPVTSFETATGEYTLQQINLEERTVTVEKKASEESEAKTRTLSAPAKTPNPKTTETEDDSDEPSQAEDDFGFGF